MLKTLKRIAIVLGALSLLALVAAAVGAIWLRAQLRSSLPQIEGRISLDGLGAAVEIDRDDHGVPTIRATDRLDVATATGFVHAQDRFFQMDLARRMAAGELSELFGRAALNVDRSVRVHGFLALAPRIVDRLPADRRALLDAYTAGVNAGLAGIERPPEYLALRLEPRRWKAEDCILVVFSMYLQLQGDDGRRESQVGLMADLLPAQLFDFLVPRGTDWDAPLVGEPFDMPDIPGSAVFDLRRMGAVKAARVGGQEIEVDTNAPLGSNNWAVAGSRTVDGHALLANDMHLGLSMPGIWYRASFAWPGEGGRLHRVTGVTLPGAPMMIVGSNGQVAWGFTNSQGDWSDLVVVEPEPGNVRRYRTPDGSREFSRREERIRIKGDDDETVEVVSTIWGPLVDRDHLDRPRALRWVAHDLEGTNLELIRMETARSIEEALEIGAVAGIPTQNLVIADSGGRIAWTLIGKIPVRVGWDGRRPASWADGGRGWSRWLEAERYPRLVDPASGLIWSANNRLVDGQPFELLGDGGLVLGARARQIRDRLRELERADVADMLSIQLDDRALLMRRWRDLLLDTLDAAAVADDPGRLALKRQLEVGWTDRASIESTAYRLARAFRLTLAEQVFGAITASCSQADARFNYLGATFQWEGPLWRLVQERPPHLLDPRYDAWNEQLLAAADSAIANLTSRHGEQLEQITWGKRNTVILRHPMSGGLPAAARWLDSAAVELPGDSDMPRVQSPSFGASQRMAVSPGREQYGYLHIPGGQSGHPLSPFYLAGHQDWVDGTAAPFLPGAAEHRLILAPAAP